MPRAQSLGPVKDDCEATLFTSKHPWGSEGGIGKPYEQQSCPCGKFSVGHTTPNRDWAGKKGKHEWSRATHHPKTAEPVILHIALPLLPSPHLQAACSTILKVNPDDWQLLPMTHTLHGQSGLLWFCMSFSLVERRFSCSVMDLKRVFLAAPLQREELCSGLHQKAHTVTM